MGDKSRQKTETKKVGKSIKEKRADKRMASGATKDNPGIMPPKKD
ncbi:unannotated protein [freshwater metagenome]|uniref:Unannotated protein n=1 Tax=freshwater metagenome TaxID=449393 RepID=A0A6J7EFG7_9ZZZZ